MNVCSKGIIICVHLLVSSLPAVQFVSKAALFVCHAIVSRSHTRGDLSLGDSGLPGVQTIWGVRRVVLIRAHGRQYGLVQSRLAKVHTSSS